MNQMMVDLETLGTTSDSVILQLGFCVFNYEDGIIHQENHHLDLDEQSDRRIDSSTVLWWMNQTEEARKAVFTRPQTITKEAAWTQLSNQLNGVSNVWANSPSFDLAMLKSYFDGDTPWSFRVELDFRTIVAELDHDRKLRPPSNPNKHVAMFDAIWQAEYLINIRRAK